jgi:hypothetical protein
MNNANQMNGLYPIIRRVRRPLLPAEVLPDGRQVDAKPAPAPVKLEPEGVKDSGETENDANAHEQSE